MEAVEPSFLEVKNKLIWLSSVTSPHTVTQPLLTHRNHTHPGEILFFSMEC